jgi:hypothetical protein
VRRALIDDNPQHINVVVLRVTIAH